MLPENTRDETVKKAPLVVKKDLAPNPMATYQLKSNPEGGVRSAISAPLHVASNLNRGASLGPSTGVQRLTNPVVMIPQAIPRHRPPSPAIGSVPTGKTVIGILFFSFNKTFVQKFYDLGYFFSTLKGPMPPPAPAVVTPGLNQPSKNQLNAPPKVTQPPAVQFQQQQQQVKNISTNVAPFTKAVNNSTPSTVTTTPTAAPITKPNEDHEFVRVNLNNRNFGPPPAPKLATQASQQQSQPKTQQQQPVTAQVVTQRRSPTQPGKVNTTVTKTIVQHQTTIKPFAQPLNYPQQPKTQLTTAAQSQPSQQQPQVRPQLKLVETQRPTALVGPQVCS
jgi:hypothetical protein